MHAGYLLVASFTAFFMDVAASFFGIGPEAVLIAAAPHTGIGFIEAHGLAFILGLLLWGTFYRGFLFSGGCFDLF